MSEKGVSYFPQLDDRDWLFKKHIKEKLNLTQIAKLVGCCDNHTVSKSLKRLGIPQQRYKTTFSEEVIGQRSESTKGTNNPMYGKHHTKEAKKKISEGHKGKPGLVGEKNPMFGKPSPFRGRKHTNASKKKMADAQRGI